MDTLKVAVCEMTSCNDWGSNQKQILSKLNTIAASRPDFVSFPENSLYFRLSDKDEIKGIELDNSIFDPIQDFARHNSCLIHLGSVPVLEEARLFNSSVLLYPNGQRTVIYRKMHLFDVAIAGHRAYRESDAFSHGPRPEVFDWKNWKFGASICYDLRFSELYQAYARAQVDVILIPSAFTVPTGQAHWATLIRARSIESQCYVLAAAQQGKHGEKRETYGHSMIVGPWGEVIAEAGPGDSLTATLDKANIQKVRAQIPMHSHRHDTSTWPTTWTFTKS